MRHNPDVCKELLEILLEFKIDIVAEDIFKTEYNIEIQRADKGSSGKRIRYHQVTIYFLMMVVI